MIPQLHLVAASIVILISDEIEIRNVGIENQVNISSWSTGVIAITPLHVAIVFPKGSGSIKAIS
jgi:hypothetical protein